MNIAFLTTHYPTPDPACLDTRAGHYWAREWVKAGHAVTIFHLRSKLVWKEPCDQTLREYTIEGIPVFYLEYPRYIPHDDRVPALTASRAAGKIAGRLEAFHPDLVICDFCSGNWDVIRALQKHKPLQGRPFVPVFNNCDLYSLRRARAIMRQSSVAGARSASIAQRIKALAPDRSVFIAYSGAPDVDGEPVQQKIREQRTPRRLIFVGDFIPLKNVDVLLTALTRLRAYALELWIVGDGPLEDELKSCAKANGLENVTFLGRVDRDEVMRRMLLSDIFVMVSSPESFGIVYIEAMASGCYVIASKGEGIDGVVIDGQNGALVPPRNAHALAEKLTEYLNLSKEDRTAILEAAVATAHEYSEEAVARKFLDDIGRLRG